jgi:hypothetical protein
MGLGIRLYLEELLKVRIFTCMGRYPHHFMMLLLQQLIGYFSDGTGCAKEQDSFLHGFKQHLLQANNPLSETWFKKL